MAHEKEFGAVEGAAGVNNIGMSMIRVTVMCHEVS